MNSLRCVHIGNFALPEKGHVKSLKSYAKFYNELANGKTDITVFAGYILPGETGYEFSNEEQLSNKIRLTLSKGNTPTTRLPFFIWNNLVILFRLTLFSLKKDNYFIFLPSPIGAWATLVISFFKRKKTLGIYLGGYYQREQTFEKRNGFFKKKIKKVAAFFVEKLVSYSIRKADYVITPSYELFHSFQTTGKIFLTPPMMNVDELDLKTSYRREDVKCISYCGELRHAKGVIDLMKAFIKLVREKKLVDYKLKIIGSGQAYDELVSLAKENRIEEFVLFCGQIKDKTEVKKAIGSSTIFVLPSYSEGFPRVAYECFTLGVPTILTPVGGIPFLLKDKTHCLFTDPGDINGLASAIESLLNDKDLQNELIENSKNLMVGSVFPRVKSDISLANVVKKKLNKTA